MNEAGENEGSLRTRGRADAVWAMVVMINTTVVARGQQTVGSPTFVICASPLLQGSSAGASYDGADDEANVTEECTILHYGTCARALGDDCRSLLSFLHGAYKKSGPKRGRGRIQSHCSGFNSTAKSLDPSFRWGDDSRFTVEAKHQCPPPPAPAFAPNGGLASQITTISERKIQPSTCMISLNEICNPCALMVWFNIASVVCVSLL